MPIHYKVLNIYVNKKSPSRVIILRLLTKLVIPRRKLCSYQTCQKRKRNYRITAFLCRP